jgi:hypothetical protein
MEADETRNPQSFSELRGEVDGIWNKVKLTSRYVAAFIGYTATEYINNAVAVIGNTDPSTYNAEREQRRTTHVCLN